MEFFYYYYFTVCAVNYLTSNFSCISYHKEGYEQVVQWDCFMLLCLWTAKSEEAAQTEVCHPPPGDSFQQTRGVNLLDQHTKLQIVKRL